MLQATMLNGRSFNRLALFYDGWCHAEGRAGGALVAYNLKVARVIGVLERRLDLAFVIARQEVVLEQDAVRGDRC